MTMTVRLLNCKPGEVLSVSQIHLEEALNHRLQILGVVPGSRILVLHKKRCGTMVVRALGARYALGAGAAKGIVGVRVS